jgi:nitroreductase
MDSQSWAFGVIQGRERLQELGKRAQVALLAEFDRQGVTGDFRDRVSGEDFAPFYGAPALVVIYATGGDQFGNVNCTLAAQNLMLAAPALGLGTCWIGLAGPLFSDPDFRRELGVPEDCEAIAPIIVGYPAEETPAKEKNPPKVLFWE